MSQFWQGVGEAEEGFFNIFSFDDKSMNSLEVVFV